jgi:hypothetical protein
MGLLGRGISLSQGRYLLMGQHIHRINAHKHPCLQWDLNPRSQCWRGRRQIMLWTALPLWSASFQILSSSSVVLPTGCLHRNVTPVTGLSGADCECSLVLKWAPVALSAAQRSLCYRRFQTSPCILGSKEDSQQTTGSHLIEVSFQC